MFLLLGPSKHRTSKSKSKAPLAVASEIRHIAAGPAAMGRSAPLDRQLVGQARIAGSMRRPSPARDVPVAIALLPGDLRVLLRGVAGR